MSRRLITVAVVAVLASGCLNPPRPATFAEACADGQVEHCRPEVCAEFEPDDLPDGCLEQADGDSTDDHNGALDAVDIGPELSEVVDEVDAVTDVPDGDEPDAETTDADVETADADAETTTVDVQDSSVDEEVEDVDVQDEGPPDCSDLNGPCHLGVWDGQACVAEPTPGASCSDGDPCTEDDACDDAGTCAGSTKDCSSLTDQCNTGTCEGGECVASPVADGSSCDIGIPCTVSSCMSGSCTGASAVSDGTPCGADAVCLSAACVQDAAYVPAGTFEMGCTTEDAECSTESQPQHTVYVPAFAIDVFEATVQQYTDCAYGLACPPDLAPSCPELASMPDDVAIRCVQPSVAANYCAWKGKRLCTEAEWERAARGDDQRSYPWGEAAPDCARAHYNGCSGDEGPVVPGTHPSGISPFGVHDMSGNAGEWVEDCWHGSYDGAPTDGSAWETSCLPAATARGGAYFSDGPQLLTWARGNVPHQLLPGSAIWVGIRCCWTP